MPEANPSLTAPIDQAAEFRVLGPVEAIVEGNPLVLGGRRQRALLALLLTAPGRVVSADRLVDELWAGEPPAGSDITLRSYVSRLRATLGGAAAIRAAGGGYALDAEPRLSGSCLPRPENRRHPAFKARPWPRADDRSAVPRGLGDEPLPEERAHPRTLALLAGDTDA